MEAALLEAKILEYLRDRLVAAEAELDRDTELVGTGLLDSGHLVRLATHVERIAGIRIPDVDIDAEHFDTVALIVAYVTAKLEG